MSVRIPVTDRDAEVRIGNLNEWYVTCDDVNRPDYLHLDLDPVPGRVRLEEHL
ncbi:MAG TPA: hypothetical protein VES20_21410 [Bryobacteraceae bacterium]|nr:hypothetical protein [Bryobacteraceae bacterium]